MPERDPSAPTVSDARKAEFGIGCHVRVIKKRVCRCATRALRLHGVGLGILRACRALVTLGSRDELEISKSLPADQILKVPY